MAGLLNEPAHKPKKKREPDFPEFAFDRDLDYTSAYPCHVCGDEFKSRFELATHPHPKRGNR